MQRTTSTELMRNARAHARAHARQLCVRWMHFGGFELICVGRESFLAADLRPSRSNNVPILILRPLARRVATRVSGSNSWVVVCGWVVVVCVCVGGGGWGGGGEQQPRHALGNRGNSHHQNGGCAWPPPSGGQASRGPEVQRSSWEFDNRKFLHYALHGASGIRPVAPSVRSAPFAAPPGSLP